MKSSGLLIILLFFAWNSRAAGQTESIPVLDFDQFEHMLYRDTDSVYVVNFWATWCAPCVREIPYFEALHERYASQGVRVVLVSLDFPNHLHSRLIPFIQERDMQSQVLLLDDANANRWIPMVDERWNGAIPATLIYRRDFRTFREGVISLAELEEIIHPLLEQ